MKLWPTTTENKCFVKMLWHLLSKYVKTIVLLVCPSSFFFFFFSVIDLCSFFYSIFALFIQRFSLFICSSILVSHFFFLNSSYSTKWHSSNIFFFFSLPFVLFFLLNIYKNPHIYCYTNTTNFTIFSQLLKC